MQKRKKPLKNQERTCKDNGIPVVDMKYDDLPLMQQLIS
jgi:hypothetical protein